MVHNSFKTQFVYSITYFFIEEMVLFELTFLILVESSMFKALQ